MRTRDDAKQLVQIVQDRGRHLVDEVCQFWSPVYTIHYNVDVWLLLLYFTPRID